MHIIVCVKQVPIPSDVAIDPVTGVLQRTGLESKMNPYDLFAVEEALRIRERFGGTITAITMGPPQAEEVIRECFYMGVDEGTILTDKRFAGSDVWATAHTLSQGILTMGSYDLIICGKQTTDGDTAQVGPEIAEFLSIPHATNVTHIIDVDLKDNQNFIHFEEERDWAIQSCIMPLPSLLTTGKDINEPRLPSYRKMKECRDKQIHTLAFKDLSDPNIFHYGLDGSPTQVVKIFPPEHHTEHVRYEGTPEEVSEKFFEILTRNKLI